MQSGKILPVIRQLFRPVNTVKSAHKDAQNSYGQSSQQQQKDPSDEEIFQALELLNQQDDIRKNGISAVAERLEGKLLILVKDSSGVVLRTLNSSDIFRILQVGKITHDTVQIGRILDRRI